jgi:hypothetical protein
MPLTTANNSRSSALDSGLPRLRVRTFAVVTAVLILGFMASPGSSSAGPPVAGVGGSPGREVFKGMQYRDTEEVALPASNGYRVTVVAKTGNATAGPAAREVRLIAERGDQDIEYLTHGTVTATSIQASFGRFGKVSLHFHPSGGAIRIASAKGCSVSGPPAVRARPGTFTGTARFSGEGRYTEVFSGNGGGAPGAQLTRTLGLSCKSFSIGSRAGDPVDLTARASTGDGRIEFAASTSRPRGTAASGGPYGFSASVLEKSEGVSIVHAVTASGPADDFTFDSGLTSATLTPPAPFTGSGTYARNADGSTSWLGTIAVPFSGVGVIPLTGPTFEGQLGSRPLIPSGEDR